MILSALILVLSTALLFFYLQTICQRVLQRQFSHPYFKAIVRAYRLEFPCVLEGAEISTGQTGQVSTRNRLAADYLTLDYLLAKRAHHRLLLGERFLKLYFRLALSTLSLRRRLGLRDRAVFHRLAIILQYFANVVGEQMPALTASD